MACAAASAPLLPCLNRQVWSAGATRLTAHAFRVVAGRCLSSVAAVPTSLLPPTSSSRLLRALNLIQVYQVPPTCQVCAGRVCGCTCV